MSATDNIYALVSRVMASLLLVLFALLSPVSGWCGEIDDCGDDESAGPVCCVEFDHQDSSDTGDSGVQCSPECWGCGLSLFTVPDMQLSAVQSREIIYLVGNTQIHPSMKLPPPDQPPRATLS